MFWINLGLLAGLSAGFAMLVVGTINRLHGFRLGERGLHRLHLVHDLLITAFPVLLFTFVGILGPGLLRGGSWMDLSAGWWVVCGGCALSGLAFVGSSLANVLRFPPHAQLSLQSRTLDIAAELGYRPVGPGPYDFMTRLPGNEFLKLEITEQEFCLPRLPSDCDGLTILHLSDFHFIGTVDRPYFERVLEHAQTLEPDLIVFTGDLIDNLSLLDWLPETLGKLSAPLGRYFILGNHDWYRDPDAIRAAVLDLGWEDVSNGYVIREYHRQKLLLAGTESPWMGTLPNISSAPEDALRILLSHTPDNLPWARRQKFDLMLSGHNHGGQIQLPGLGPVYSPSKFGCKYAAGVFWEAPTLLNVSRGLSGKHPLRYNCKPQISKLTLRSQAYVEENLTAKLPQIALEPA